MPVIQSSAAVRVSFVALSLSCQSGTSSALEQLQTPCISGSRSTSCLEDGVHVLALAVPTAKQVYSETRSEDAIPVGRRA